MVDPLKTATDAEARAKYAIKSAETEAVSWFAHPVPLWVTVSVALAALLLGFIL